MTALALVFWGRASVYSRSDLRESLPSSAARSSFQSEEGIVLYYHERHPFYVTNSGGVYGLIADRVNRVFEAAGIPYTWHKIPAKRQLEMIQRNDHEACAVGWFQNPEREAFGKFSLAIYTDGPILALARADNHQIQSGQALAVTLANRRLRLLRKDGYSYGPFVDAALERHAPRQTVTAAENLGMINMIHSHRADYFFSTGVEARELILGSGLPEGDFKLVDFSDMPSGNRRYLICSGQLAEATLRRIDQAIERHLPDGLAANPIPMSLAR